MKLTEHHKMIIFYALEAFNRAIDYNNVKKSFIFNRSFYSPQIKVFNNEFESEQELKKMIDELMALMCED